jgi:RNA polymerase sigma-70 factor (ECF subfamily)
MHHRAGERLAGGRDRFRPSPGDHARLLTGFLKAAREGDLTTLTEMLSKEVIAWNDGGGKVRAALHPVAGRRNVLAFVTGLVSRYPIGETRVVEANGEPAIWMTMGDRDQLVTLAIRDGRIHAIFGVLNPDKLAYVRPGSGG